MNQTFAIHEGLLLSEECKSTNADQTLLFPDILFKDHFNTISSAFYNPKQIFDQYLYLIINVQLLTVIKIFAKFQRVHNHHTV